MKLYQDAAGTVPATQPGHPVGLVVSQAGRINHSQSTTLSKPTLAYWPRTGVRNLARGVDDTTLWTQSMINGGATWEVVGGGLEGGQPYTDLRCHGTLTAAATYYGSLRSLTIVDAVMGATYNGRLTVRRIAGTEPTQVAGKGFRAQVGGVDAGGGYSEGGNGSAARNLDTDTLVAVNRQISVASTVRCFFQIYLDLNIGDVVDITYRIKGVQFEFGAEQTPRQLNYGLNHVVEPNVQGLWHLYNDGGDSLNAVYPAGTYGVGYLSADLVPTFTTVVSDGVTSISSLFTARQADVVIRPGEFTQADKDKIIESWGRI